jgi:hypothetical protein
VGKIWPGGLNLLSRSKKWSGVREGRRRENRGINYEVTLCRWGYTMHRRSAIKRVGLWQKRRQYGRQPDLYVWNDDLFDEYHIVIQVNFFAKIWNELVTNKEWKSKYHSGKGCLFHIPAQGHIRHKSFIRLRKCICAIKGSSLVNPLTTGSRKNLPSVFNPWPAQMTWVCITPLV